MLSWNQHERVEKKEKKLLLPRRFLVLLSVVLLMDFGELFSEDLKNFKNSTISESCWKWFDSKFDSETLQTSIAKKFLKSTSFKFNGFESFLPTFLMKTLSTSF